MGEKAGGRKGREGEEKGRSKLQLNPSPIIWLGPTFRIEIITSRRAGSFFKHEQSNIEFESSTAQYCSS